MGLAFGFYGNPERGPRELRQPRAGDITCYPRERGRFGVVLAGCPQTARVDEV